VVGAGKVGAGKVEGAEVVVDGLVTGGPSFRESVWVITDTGSPPPRNDEPIATRPSTTASPIDARLVIDRTSRRVADPTRITTISGGITPGSGRRSGGYHCPSRARHQPSGGTCSES